MSHSVVHCYPSPVGTLTYYKSGRQCSHDMKYWTERGFRFLPTKVSRFLGATVLEFRITVHPTFDRYVFDFSGTIHRKYDDEVVKALGFNPETLVHWGTLSPDFPLLRKLLEDRKISPNDRYQALHGGPTLLEVKNEPTPLLTFHIMPLVGSG